MSCGTPFTVHFATTFTILGFRKKKYFYNFLLCPLRHGHAKRTKFHFSTTFTTPRSWKKLFTLSFIKNILSATKSTTPRSWQKDIYFHFNTTIFTTPCWWNKKILFPLLLIATTPTTSWLCQKYIFPIATTFTTFVIMTKRFFFVTATFTTPWLALRPLRPG